MKSKIYKDVFKFVWIPILLDAITSSLGGVLSVFSSNIFGKFTDAVFSLDIPAGLENISSLFLALVITVLVIPVIYYIEDIILVKSSLSHDRTVLSRFLEKNFMSASKIEAGDMLGRLDEDPNELRQELNTVIPAGFTIVTTVVYLLPNVIQINISYAVIMVLVSLVKFIVPILTNKYVQKYHREDKEYVSRVHIYETEICERPYNVIFMGLGEKYLDFLDKLYRSFFQNTQKKSIRLSLVSSSVNSFVDTVCMLIVLLVGAFLAAKGTISVGSITAMTGYFSVLNSVIGNVNYIIREIPIVDNLVERLTFFYTDEERSEGEHINTFNGLSVSQLSFSYGNKQVIESVSFSVNKGDKIVIYGNNGSGKSTLVKILLGLLTDYTGTIKINDRDLSKISIADYREIVAYAPQEPYLFRGTVLENIKIANPTVDDLTIEILLNRFEISYLYDREITCGGNELSGGEKQKISLIRAIVKDSPVIFVDEPENNLDNSAMKTVEKFIRDSDKTIIFISHNPLLIECADRRVILESKINHQ